MMQIPLQITIRKIGASEALEARIRDKAADLERFHPRITSCRVTVEEADRHHHQGRQFAVRLDVRAPGHADIVVTRHHDQDVYVALRDAFDAATRQLEDVARELRQDVKTHPTTQHGTVARLVADGEYGFVTAADGRELYFNRDNVVEGTFDDLVPGMPVKFIEAAGDNGPQAKRVRSARQHPRPT
jgi:ribosomal subunit interface protein